MHMPEEEAFDVFTVLMQSYRLRGLFRPNMADLTLRLFQLEGLVHSFFPALGAHFAELGVDMSMFASQWFLTLFGSSLPLELVFRIVDVFFLEGFEVIFQAALVILADHQAFLARQSFEEILKFFGHTHLCTQYAQADHDQFIADLAKFKGLHKRLAKLERDHEAQKQSEAQQECELTKAREECDTLRKENKELKTKVGQ